MSSEVELGRLIVAELREEFLAVVTLDSQGRVRVKPSRSSRIGAFFLARIAEHREAIAAALREEEQARRQRASAVSSTGKEIHT